MEIKQIEKVLCEHKKWLSAEEGGQRADLRDANLQRADLQGVNLRGADLRGADLQDADLRDANLQDAYLQGANLQRANLRGADLRSANLQDADLQDAYLRGANLQDTVYDGVNWLLLLGIVPDAKGNARAYKIINDKGEGIYQGGINYLKATKFKVPKVDEDLTRQCSFGIHLATLAWCLAEKREWHRLLLMKFKFKDAVCPIGSDGKFRVKACTKVGECDWKGNLNP